MIVAALTGGVPEPFTADCAHCGRPTTAPVAVGWIDRSIRYACPHCAPFLTPGPTPDEHPRAVSGETR
ncbi:hypothetical protein [Streptomyces sp. NPDC004726]